MIVIPAIDIKDKKCVRLSQGDFARVEVYSEDPKSVAENFVKQGADCIHVVDLDGAREGRIVNFGVICQLSSVAPIQVGGGIRSPEDLEKIIGIGARAIVSSAVVSNENFRKVAIGLKDKVSLAIDALEGKIVTNGWKTETDLDAFEFAKRNESICSSMIFTSVLRDGMLEGPDFEAIKKMKKEISVPLMAAGGISSYDDLRKLREIGVYGCIVGKALYNGRIKLAKAINESKKS